jgi:hypothetical protein
LPVVVVAAVLLLVILVGVGVPVDTELAQEPPVGAVLLNQNLFLQQGSPTSFLLVLVVGLLVMGLTRFWEAFSLLAVGVVVLDGMVSGMVSLAVLVVVQVETLDFWLALVQRIRVALAVLGIAPGSPVAVEVVGLPLWEVPRLQVLPVVGALALLLQLLVPL